MNGTRPRVVTLSAEMASYTHAEQADVQCEA